MMKNRIRISLKKMTAFLTVIFLLSGMVTLCGTISCKATAGDGITSAQEYILRPSEAGQLHVQGTMLAAEDGRTVMLQGVSLHGLTWYPQYVNQALFSWVSEDWNTNLIRLPVYSDLYSEGQQAESLELLEKGTEYAAAADMYALIDWHILEDNDPNQNLSSAVEFFKTVSEKYADYDNVLYEICNEPNGDTTWEDVRSYAEIIIPVIRSSDPDAVIVVGTPDYDRDLSSPMQSPLDYDNVMYTFHFYAASHGQAMMDTLTTALDAGLPVFITECGICESSGDGTVDYSQAKQWFNLLHERHLSYAVWSLSNKQESSAMIKGTCTRKGALTVKNLTTPGLWLRAMFRGDNVDAVAVTESGWDLFYNRLRATPVLSWSVFAGITLGWLLLVAVATILAGKIRHRKKRTYDELIRRTGGYMENLQKQTPKQKRSRRMVLTGKALLLCTTFLTFIYLLWRIVFSIPVGYGWFAILCNLLLLAVEMVGFAESLIHYYSMLGLTEHPLPVIRPEEYPDVDIFISTYSEPVSLLRKTIIGCKNMDYPDFSRVHIYLCDDNRRPEMKALALELGIHYFDRQHHDGAKAGNLNHALQLTASPYIVTFDADMIPRREFLMHTIPYYVDAEKRNALLAPEEQLPLGLLQTPQCFYNPDVFQHNLYNEKHIPNEQDFFYRTIEAARTSSNSVIYGGSNTVLSRRALEEIGGFYTKTITEDFATGLLIESAGYVSLGISEPLASGLAPTSFKEHVQQRTRWGRGVIRTGRQLKFLRSKKLTAEQKRSYWSSVVYWYSPLKNFICMLSPLVFALLGIPVFRCTMTDILLFWLPMFVLQDLTLRAISGRTMSAKWSGIQETAVMPFLLVPILKESLGITLSTFKVTNKENTPSARKAEYRMLLPFAVMILLFVLAIIRRGSDLISSHEFGLIVILFWLIRNLYFLLIGLFLVDGRARDGENVHVYDAEPVTAAGVYEGITTHLTEHSLRVFLDRQDALQLGSIVDLAITGSAGELTVKGIVIGIRKSEKAAVPCVYSLEILDFYGQKDAYIAMLYDRIPTLPQKYHRELGILPDLWRNITKRLAHDD